MSSDIKELEVVYGPDEHECGSDSLFIKMVKLLAKIWGQFGFYFCWFIGPLFFIYFSFYRLFQPIAALYICWMYYDRKTPFEGGRKLNFMKKLWFWKINRTYFPAKLVKTCELPANRNYLFATFPHGILCYGIQYNIVSDGNDFDKAFPGLDVHFAAMNGFFYSPVTRDLCLAQGGVSARAGSIQRILNGPPGSVCVVIVGGVEELCNCGPGPYRLVVRNRKGFVRLALKSGCPLVPVFTFGETYTHAQYSSQMLRNICKKLSLNFIFLSVAIIGAILFQNLFGIIPRRCPLTTVVGKPIPLPKVECPSEQLVNEYHGRFIVELEKLFEKYKGKYDMMGNEATLVLE